MDTLNSFVIRVAGSCAGTVITNDEKVGAKQALMKYAQTMGFEQVVDPVVHNNNMLAIRSFKTKHDTSAIVDALASPTTIMM